MKTRLYYYSTIAAFAVLLSFPAFLHPPPLFQSWWVDWVWADQFTAQLATGNLLPRWLPLSHDGLGAPVFYYYGPVAFYVSGLFGLMGLTTHASLLAAFACALAASGVAMFHWLKGWTTHPLLAALFYMAAPYHVFDFYRRGALAEVVGIALLPVLALGLRRVSERRGYGLVAVAYAGLIATHLPLALLASIFLIGPYALFLSRGRLKELIAFAPPLLLGIGLAALFLIPALALDPYRDSIHLWPSPEFRPENWVMFGLRLDQPTPFAFLIAACAAAVALPAIVIAIKWRTPWALYCLGCIAVIAGSLPGFWSLPLIERVQFPFRALPIAEFGLATAFALLPRREFLGLILATPALALSCALALTTTADDAPSEALLRSRHPDVLEYLPKGVADSNWNVTWNVGISRGRVPPPIRNGWTVDPVFYFPAWRVTCQGRRVDTFPDPETQLLSYRGGNCERGLVWTAAEQAGAVISMLAALLLLVLWRRRARRDQLPIPVEPL